MSWFQEMLYGKLGLFRRLILKAIGLLIGRITNDLYAVVKNAVVAAEKTNKKGWEKWEIAYKDIQKNLHGTSYPEYIISILIELVVSEINPKT
jgi:hypothetical protein